MEVLEVLLYDDNGYPIFLIDKKLDNDYYFDFKVYAVNSWEIDENHTPSEIEEYVSGSVKWDGCSHVYFGEEGEGYLHLCGKSWWENHAKVMLSVYEIAEKTIPKYNKEVAEI